MFLWCFIDLVRFLTLRNQNNICLKSWKERVSDPKFITGDLIFWCCVWFYQGHKYLYALFWTLRLLFYSSACESAEVSFLCWVRALNSSPFPSWFDDALNSTESYNFSFSVSGWAGQKSKKTKLLFLERGTRRWANIDSLKRKKSTELWLYVTPQKTQAVTFLTAPVSANLLRIKTGSVSVLRCAESPLISERLDVLERSLSPRAQRSRASDASAACCVHTV